MARWDTGLDLCVPFTKNAGRHRRPLKPRSGRVIRVRYLTISPSGQPDVFSLTLVFRLLTSLAGSFRSSLRPSSTPAPLDPPVDHLGEITVRRQGEATIGHDVPVNVPAVAIRGSQGFVSWISWLVRRVPSFGSVPTRQERGLQCFWLEV